MRHKHAYCLILLLTLLGCGSLFAQRRVSDSTPLYSVSTQGGYYSNGKINVSYNIGDPIFYSDSNFFETYIIFQGFEQPDRFDVVPPVITGDNFEIKYGPNPFKDYIDITIVSTDGLPSKESFTISVIDVLGRRMPVKEVDGITFSPYLEQNNLIRLNLYDLTADQVYYFTIKAVNGDFLRTIKLVKVD